MGMIVNYCYESGKREEQRDKAEIRQAAAKSPMDLQRIQQLNKIKRSWQRQEELLDQICF